MTKNEIKADLCLAINLSKQLENMLRKIENELNAGDDTIVEYWFNKICSFEPTDIDTIMADFENNECFADNDITDDGPIIIIPELNIDDNRDITIRVPVNGGKLIAANTCMPTGLNQVSLEYECNENDEDSITLATADVKSGKYAELNHIHKDNKDIVLHTYADVYTEDYTASTTIPFNDIVKSLTCE